MEGDAQEEKSEKLAKELFPESPNIPGRGRKKRDESGRSGGLGCLAVLLFFVVCLLATLVTVQLNNGWRELTLEDVSKFFSNEPLKNVDPTLSSIFYFHGQYLFGWLGALPLAVTVGGVCGLFTFLFMFYDSNVPGDFPPTPVSPRKQTRVDDNSRWHLGYIFVPVNFLVTLSLALFYFRVHMGLPCL